MLQPLRMLVFGFSLLCMPQAHAAPRALNEANLTVIVDQNLMVAAGKLARAYASATGTPLTMVVKDSAAAETEILQGLEAHILLSANQTLLERLAAQGLTDVSSTQHFARTRLALVGNHAVARQEALARRISFTAILYATPHLPVLVTPPDSLAGTRAASLLQGFEFSATLAQRIQPSENTEEMIETMLTEPALGLLLASDASPHKELNVLNLLPETISPPVYFDVVVLASESMEPSRQFARFLLLPEAQAILRSAGFEAVEK